MLKFIEGERIMLYSSSLRGKQRRDISKKNLLGEKCDALILRFMRYVAKAKKNRKFLERRFKMTV